ncbi:MAG: hemolysin family protein [Patescibacteria group bacterium]
MLINTIILIALLLIAGFFSAAESALLSITDVKVRTFLKQKKRGAGTLQKLKRNPRRMIIVILVGNNVANISAASLMSIIVNDSFGSAALGYATGILTLLVLIFGEITPKTFANRFSGTISLWISRPIYLFGIVIFPVTWLLEWITSAMHKLVKVQDHESITETEIKEMIQFGVEKNVIEPHEQYIMNRALKFSDISVKEIMVPFKNIFSLPGEKNVAEAMNKIILSGYSRVPIYERDPKNIVSVALAKDIARQLVKKNDSIQINQIAKKPIIVDEDFKIKYLFKIFQRTHVHIAVIVDKQQRTVGIATLEDLLEELVGEIEDESDKIESGQIA